MARADVSDQQHAPGPQTWIKPGYAVLVVALAAFVIVVILGWALVELRIGSTTAGENAGPVADPNAGTIAALASAAFTSLTSLVAAYFGIKIATEHSAQASQTAKEALSVATTAVQGNSTANGNPKPNEV